MTTETHEQLKKVCFFLLLISTVFIFELRAQTCVCDGYGPELVVNGDFSLGNTGFTSDYTFSSPAVPGRYGISATPWTANSFWSHCTDHTSGSGNLMWVDCSDTASLNMWTQTITNTNLNTDYYFSCWLTTLDHNSTSTLEFSINGQVIGNPITTPVATCNWVQFCFIWNSGNNNSATISFANQSFIAVGNDVGIDDISFRVCCHALSSDVFSSICNGDSYQLPGGVTVSMGGIYNDTLTTYLGCDSVIITHLTVLPTSSFIQNISICDGQSYFAAGAFQTASGTYLDTFVNYLGCDSMVTTNLTVLPNSAATINVSICQGQSYFAGGAFQTATGIYSDLLVNYLGCDSVLTTNLTVLPVSSSTITASICEGQSYFAGGTFQTTTGIYHDTLINFVGCDSVVTTNLTVLVNSLVTVNASICQGDSYFAGGAFQTSSGVYLDVYTNYLGCDSIVTTNLTVLANTALTKNVSICDGQSYLAGGSYQTQTGIYFDTILNAAGCDSVITTNLSVLPNSSFTQNISICFGDSIFLGTAWQTQSGTYLDHYLNYLVCDSALTTILNVYPLITTNVFATICNGQTYYAGGANQSQSGIYTDTLVAVSGCDSIVTTNLTVLLPISTHVYPSICEGQNYYAGGNWQISAGVYYDTLTSFMGCDSTVITHLTVNPTPAIDLGNDTAFCAGESIMLSAGNGYQSYLWQDQSSQPFFVAEDVGSYWVMVTNSFGCTSSDTLLVTNVYPLPDQFLPPDTVICGNIPLIIKVEGYQNYLWSDGDTSMNHVIKAEGIYELQVTDVHGCTGSDDISIKNACDEDILIPNAFTPNGDGLNDIFLPIIVKNLSEYRIVIFNRWGRKVFESPDPILGWNGIDNGLSGEIGVYFWTIDYTLESGPRKAIDGTVTLLR